MYSFRSATLWPLTFIACFLLLSSCKKDKFEPSLDPVSNSSQHSANLPISIADAKSYYESLNLPSQTSFAGDSTRILNILVEPKWDRAFLSNSSSGRDIIVVPLADTSISRLNHGRADVKLLFTRFSADTIAVDVVLYVADSTYYSSLSQEISFSTFTGLFVLFDLGLHFKYGVRVENGAPIGLIKDIYKSGNLSKADDREDGDQDCFTEFEVVYEPCLITFSGCEQAVVVSYEDCTGNGGGGGGNGGNGGGNGGNGGNGGYGGGGVGGVGGQVDTIQNVNNNYNIYSTVDYTVIFGLIPVHVFVQGGGVLPEGLSFDEAVQLAQMNNACQFSVQQRNWLVTHSDYIGIFHGYLSNQSMSAAAIQTVKEILTAMMNNGNQVSLGALQILLQVQDGANFTATQLNWLINHQDVLKACRTFQYEYTGFDGIEDATQMLVEYVTKNQIEDISGADFSRYGEDAANCTPCFAMAWSAEYAFLKRDDPGPNPNTDPWGAKLHSMKLGAIATWKVSSTGVHFLLDFAGLIPVAGEIADLASGGIYLLEGEYVDASLSFSAALPIAGWTATGVKYARKIVTVGGKTTELTMVVVNGIVKFGTDALEGRNQLKRALNTPYAHQAHHVLPWELQEHPVIQAAAKASNNGAFHMNDILNGISLPNALGSSGLPQHLGSHPDYTERVRESLNSIEAALGNNLNPDDALRDLKQLVGKIKNKITTTSGGKINDVAGW